MAEDEGLKYFVERGRRFIVYLKSHGVMKPFRPHYEMFGLITPGAHIIYISERTGKLLIGQISSQQTPALEYINVKRINRSQSRMTPTIIYDNIQREEIMCVLGHAS